MSDQNFSSAPSEPREPRVLEWRTEKAYWNGKDAEFAWAEGTRDLHWMVDKGLLALYDNEYDRATQISHEDRSQEETKALAQSLQDVLDGEPREPERETVDLLIATLESQKSYYDWLPASERRKITCTSTIEYAIEKLREILGGASLKGTE